MYCYVSLAIQINISCFYTHLNDQTVLFLTIQFSIEYSLTVPYQLVPLRARVNFGAMAMKGCSALPEAPVLQELHHQIWLVSYTAHLLVGGWSYWSAEMQSVYSTAPADWALSNSGENLPLLLFPLWYGVVISYIFLPNWLGL